MYSDPDLEDPPEGMTRVLAFTLSTAMLWLGHTCRGGCPPEICTLRASVWSVEQAATIANEGITTLVVVRFGSVLRAADSATHRSVLNRVNRCARRDHILVRECSASDWKRGSAQPVGKAQLCVPLPMRVR